MLLPSLPGPPVGISPAHFRPLPSRVRQAARHLWSGPRASSEISDLRMRALADTIADEPDNWSRIRRKIGDIRLSPAYLSVRFKECVGLPMRSFALWMKFEHACERVVQGMRPSDAATQAGFADQSHLGRAARRFAKKSFWQAIAELQTELNKEMQLEGLAVSTSLPGDRLPFLNSVATSHSSGGGQKSPSAGPSSTKPS